MTVIAYKVNWSSAGYIDSIIGGFFLVIQGILTTISDSIGIVGELSFLSFSGIRILNGIIMILLGLAVLILVWDWLQIQFNMSTPIRNRVILGIVLIVLGLIAGGTGGILVLIGGILFLIGGIKETR